MDSVALPALDVMSADYAREIMNDFFEKNKDEVDKIMNNIHTKIVARASIGYDNVSFELSDIECPGLLKRCILDNLREEGFQISYYMGKYTLKW